MLGRGPSIRRFRFTSVLVLLALPWSAAAQDLFQVYREAQSYDAVYAVAPHDECRHILFDDGTSTPTRA